MQLSAEEQSILDGAQGPTMKKIMQSVVAYGDIFEADCLVPVEGSPHLVTSFGANTIRPYFAMLDEIIAAGLKSHAPFTVDPRPVEYDALRPSFLQRLVFKLVFGRQDAYEQQLKKLGLKNTNAFTCACYLPEVGNIPARGANLAWSESSAVVFANSVLGARTNRNSSGIDLMCDIIGKAPRFGLLTDEGRRATWLVKIKTSELPNPHLLGSAIGLRVMEDVPYIAGLDTFLGKGLCPDTQAYLKDMGAAAASNGAVGLYHVENITPEAVDHQKDLLAPGTRVYIIDDKELRRVMDSYPILWADQSARPKLVFIGCPHLSRQQVESWVERITASVRQGNKTKAGIPVYLCTPPDIAAIFKQNDTSYRQMLAMDIHITSICPLMYMNNPLCARQPILTNSNKLRTYTSARFYPDDEILNSIIRGTAPIEVKGELPEPTGAYFNMNRKALVDATTQPRVISYQGRPILPGTCRGEALVSHSGFNTLASFQTSIVLRSKTATCSDQNNPDLYHKTMTGKILCLPQTIGSTTGGLVIQTIASLGNGPKAMLFSQRIDSLAAAGVILADIWVGQRIIVVDNLGEAFLKNIQHGQQLEILDDGTVNIL